MNAQHLAQSGEWWTPQWIIDLAHEIMGGIDLDPASCPEANKRVGAKKIYTAGDNGLEQPWEGNVFLNPPGHCGRVAAMSKEGRTVTFTRACRNETRCTCDLVRKFWEKAISEYEAGKIEQLFWVGFSLNQLRTLQASREGGPLCNGEICVPEKRVGYLRPDGQPAVSPSHDSYLLYRGPEHLKAHFSFLSYGEPA